MKSILLSISLLLALTASATAGSFEMWGLQAGLTDDDNFNQSYIGGQVLVLQPVSYIDCLTGAEIGFGNGNAVLSIQADLFYNFTELETRVWQLKAGFGLTQYFKSADDLGLSVAGQILRKLIYNKQVFAEIRFGLVDSPDFKLAIGINFF